MIACPITDNNAQKLCKTIYDRVQISHFRYIIQQVSHNSTNIDIKSLIRVLSFGRGRLQKEHAVCAG